MGGVNGKEGVGVQRVEEEEEEWATRRSSSGVDCVVCEEVKVGRGMGGTGMGRRGGRDEKKGRRERTREEVEVRREGGEWSGR